jgi:hypothetical protein
MYRYLVSPSLDHPCSHTNDIPQQNLLDLKLVFNTKVNNISLATLTLPELVKSSVFKAEKSVVFITSLWSKELSVS